jgi:hypothetical protein
MPATAMKASLRAVKGIRLNNPGHIRLSSDPWQGLSPFQGDDDFFTFYRPAYGIRAIFRIIIYYQDKYGLRSITGIINRWAPPSENDTAAYIKHAAKKVGVHPEGRIDVHDYDTARALVEVIILHETGSMPYSDATMREAMLLAGLDVPVKPLAESRTIQAGTVAGTAATALVALDQVKAATDQASAIFATLHALPSWTPLVLGVLIVGAIGYMVFRRVRDQRLRVA